MILKSVIILLCALCVFSQGLVSTKPEFSSKPHPITTPSSTAATTTHSNSTPTTHNTHSPTIHTHSAPTRHTSTNTDAPITDNIHFPTRHTHSTPTRHTSQTTDAPTTHNTSAPTSHTHSAPTSHTSKITDAPSTHSTFSSTRHTHSTPTRHTTIAPTSKTTATTTTHSTSASTRHTSPTTSITTPTPKPDDLAVVNDYKGNYTGKMYFCLRMQVAIQVELMIKNNVSTYINFPEIKKVKVNIDCPVNSSNQTLKVTWAKYSVEFVLFKNETKHEYEIQSIKAILDRKKYSHKKVEFSVSDKESYRCEKELQLDLEGIPPSNSTVAKLHLYSFHYQAFMNSTQFYFSSVLDCESKEKDTWVAILIGIGILLSVFVLVGIGYSVYRRKYRQRLSYHQF